MSSLTVRVHDYFAGVPVDRHVPMQGIRQHIRELWPKVQEDLSYGIPTYHLDGRPLFALASQKHFVVFYVIPYDLLDAFKNELVVYNCGKSCIRLRQVDTAAMALLDRVIRFVGATHTESRMRLKPVMRTMAGRKRALRPKEEPIR